MPTILRWRGHRFHFYSREPNEPPHVHVTKDAAQAKIWLADASVARSVGYSDRDLAVIRREVAERKETLMEAWHAHFG